MSTAAADRNLFFYRTRRSRHDQGKAQDQDKNKDNNNDKVQDKAQGKAQGKDQGQDKDQDKDKEGSSIMGVDHEDVTPIWSPFQWSLVHYGYVGGCMMTLFYAIVVIYFSSNLTLTICYAISTLIYCIYGTVVL